MGKSSNHQSSSPFRALARRRRRLLLLLFFLSFSAISPRSLARSSRVAFFSLFCFLVLLGYWRKVLLFHDFECRASRSARGGVKFKSLGGVLELFVGLRQRSGINPCGRVFQPVSLLSKKRSTPSSFQGRPNARMERELQTRC